MIVTIRSVIDSITFSNENTLLLHNNKIIILCIFTIILIVSYYIKQVKVKTNIDENEKQKISKSRKFINESTDWKFTEKIQFTIEPQLQLIIVSFAQLCAFLNESNDTLFPNNIDIPLGGGLYHPSAIISVSLIKFFCHKSLK